MSTKLNMADYYSVLQLFEELQLDEVYTVASEGISDKFRLLQQFHSDVIRVWSWFLGIQKEWVSLVEVLPRKGQPEGVVYQWPGQERGEELSGLEYGLRAMKWSHSQFKEVEKCSFGQVKRIARRLFRVLAIVCTSRPSYAHRAFNKKLNHVLTRFMFFVWYNQLVSEREQQCIESHLHSARQLYVSLSNGEYVTYEEYREDEENEVMEHVTNAEQDQTARRRRNNVFYHLVQGF